MVICDYCDQPALYIGRDSGDVLCRAHAWEHHEDPRGSTARLTARSAATYGAPADIIATLTEGK